MAKRTKKSCQANLSQLDIIELIEIVRGSRSKEKVNAAFSEIEMRMRVKLKKISCKFNIPGFNQDDLYQEALVALRFKAIKDYDQTRGSGVGPYPFEKFAILCIRRHLSTNLKASFQNKKRVLNQSMSLDQDRNGRYDDQLFLANILSDGDDSIVEQIAESESTKEMYHELLSKLSPLEKEVLAEYIKQQSYDEIADRISVRKAKSKKSIVKSVDNALTRIKHKGSEILKKHERENPNTSSGTRIIDRGE